MLKSSFTSRLVALLALGLFHAIALAAPASLPDTLILPRASTLQHDSLRSTQTGRIELTGQAELTGLVQAYWVRAWPDGETEQRTLYLRFFPDAHSLARLPTIRAEGGADSAPRVIQLYRGAPPADAVFETAFALEAAIPLLDAAFETVPAEFFRYREGYALAPARLSLLGLTSLIECDRRMFFGGFTSIAGTDTAPTAEQQAQVHALEAQAGCAAHAPYLEYYQVRAPAPGLHPAPDPVSQPLILLEPGSQVLKLRTVDEDWVEVELANETALEHPANAVTPPVQPVAPHRGYLPSSALEPIN